MPTQDEVGGQGRVVELAEGASVGSAGIGADRGVDQAARSRGRRADRGLSRGDLGERIFTHKGNLMPAEILPL